VVDRTESYQYALDWFSQGSVAAVCRWGG